MVSDLKAKLSSKNLREGGGPRTPLRKFWGDLQDYTVKEVKYQSGDSGYAIQYDFENVEVLESTEPYDFPIAQVDISYSPNDAGEVSKNSRSGIFLDSLNAFYRENQDLPDAVGKRLLLHYTGGKQIYNRDQGGLVDTEAWQVVEAQGFSDVVEPKSKVDPLAHTLSILDGKTIQQFQQEAVKDPIVKGSEYSSQILNGQFIPTQEAAGKIGKNDDGTYSIIPD